MASTTAHFSWTTDNTAGTTGYTVRYRLAGTSDWTEYSTSGTTAAIAVTTNYIYDFQVTNINNADNPDSPIAQGINITDPDPTFSMTNSSAGYTFPNLSTDMDSYTATVALFSNPNVIISTHVLSATSTVTDTFTGLQALTQYRITITPAANQFTKTFVYTVITLADATCATPSNITATLS